MIGKYKPCVLLPSLATKYISISGKKDLTFMAYKALKFWRYILGFIFFKLSFLSYFFMTKRKQYQKINGALFEFISSCYQATLNFKNTIILYFKNYKSSLISATKYYDQIHLLTIFINTCVGLPVSTQSPSSYPGATCLLWTECKDLFPIFAG